MHQQQGNVFNDFYYHSPLSVPSHAYSFPYSYPYYSPTTTHNTVHGQNLWAQMMNNSNNRSSENNDSVKHKHSARNVSTTDSFMSRLKRFRFWSPNWWKSAFESSTFPAWSNETFEDNRVGQYDTLQQYPATTTHNTHVLPRHRDLYTSTNDMQGFNTIANKESEEDAVATLNYPSSRSFDNRSMQWWLGYLFLRFTFWPCLAVLVGYLLHFELGTILICSSFVQGITVLFAIQTLGIFQPGGPSLSSVYNGYMGSSLPSTVFGLKHYLYIIMVLIVGPCLCSLVVIDYFFGWLYMMVSLLILPVTLICLLLYASEHRVDLDLYGWKLCCSSITSKDKTRTAATTNLEHKKDNNVRIANNSDSTKGNGDTGIELNEHNKVQTCNVARTASRSDVDAATGWSQFLSSSSSPSPSSSSSSSFGVDDQYNARKDSIQVEKKKCLHPYCTVCQRVSPQRSFPGDKHKHRHCYFFCCCSWQPSKAKFRRRCNILLHDCMVLVLLLFLTSPTVMWTICGWVLQQRLIGAFVGLFIGLFISVSCFLYLYYVSFEMNIKCKTMKMTKTKTTVRDFSDSSDMAITEERYPLLGAFAKQIECGFISLTRHVYQKFLFYFELNQHDKETMG